jgi:hypothetical protein
MTPDAGGALRSCDDRGFKQESDSADSAGFHGELKKARSLDGRGGALGCDDPPAAKGTIAEDYVSRIANANVPFSQASAHAAMAPCQRIG